MVSKKKQMSAKNYKSKNIEFNNRLMQITTEKEKKLEDSLGKEVEKEHKMANMRVTPEQKKLKKDIVNYK